MRLRKPCEHGGYDAHEIDGAPVHFGERAMCLGGEFVAHDTASGVTWEQFRESILAGWTDCIPQYHFDARVAWEHLLNGGERVADDLLGTGYVVDAREAWDRT